MKRVIFGTVQTNHVFDDQFLFKRTSTLYNIIASGIESDNGTTLGTTKEDDDDDDDDTHGVAVITHVGSKTTETAKNSNNETTMNLGKSFFAINQHRIELLNDGSHSKIMLILKPEQFKTVEHDTTLAPTNGEVQNISHKRSFWTQPPPSQSPAQPQTQLQYNGELSLGRDKLIVQNDGEVGCSELFLSHKTQGDSFLSKFSKITDLIDHNVLILSSLPKLQLAPLHWTDYIINTALSVYSHRVWNDVKCRAQKKGTNPTDQNGVNNNSLTSFINLLSTNNSDLNIDDNNDPSIPEESFTIEFPFQSDSNLTTQGSIWGFDTFGLTAPLSSTLQPNHYPEIISHIYTTRARHQSSSLLEANINDLYIRHYKALRPIYASKSPLAMPYALQQQILREKLSQSGTAPSLTLMQSMPTFDPSVSLLSPGGLLSSNNLNKLNSLPSIPQTPFSPTAFPSTGTNQVVAAGSNSSPDLPLATSTLSHLPLVFHPFDDVLHQYELRDALNRLSMGLIRLYTNAVQQQQSKVVSSGEDSEMTHLQLLSMIASSPSPQSETDGDRSKNVDHQHLSSFQSSVSQLVTLFKLSTSTHLFTKLALQPNHLAALSTFMSFINTKQQHYQTLLPSAPPSTFAQSSDHHFPPGSIDPTQLLSTTFSTAELCTPHTMVKLLSVLRSHIEYITLTSFQLPTSLPLAPVPLLAPSPTRELALFQSFQILKSFFTSPMSSALALSTKHQLTQYTHELPTIAAVLKQLYQHDTTVLTTVESTEHLWNGLLHQHIFKPTKQLLVNMMKSPDTQQHDQSSALLLHQLQFMLAHLSGVTKEPNYYPLTTPLQFLAEQQSFDGYLALHDSPSNMMSLPRSPMKPSGSGNVGEGKGGDDKDERFLQLIQTNFLFRVCISESNFRPLPTSVFDLSVLPMRSIELRTDKEQFEGKYEHFMDTLQNEHQELLTKQLEDPDNAQNDIAQVEFEQRMEHLCGDGITSSSPKFIKNDHNAATKSYGQELSQYLEDEAFFSVPILAQQRADQKLAKEKQKKQSDVENGDSAATGRPNPPLLLIFLTKPRHETVAKKLSAVF